MCIEKANKLMTEDFNIKKSLNDIRQIRYELDRVKDKIKLNIGEFENDPDLKFDVIDFDKLFNGTEEKQKLKYRLNRE